MANEVAKKFYKVKDAMKYYDVSRNMLMAKAAEANALVRFGRVWRVDINKMNEILSK